MMKFYKLLVLSVLSVVLTVSTAFASVPFDAIAESTDQQEITIQYTGSYSFVNNESLTDSIKDYFVIDHAAGTLPIYTAVDLPKIVAVDFNWEETILYLDKPILPGQFLTLSKNQVGNEAFTEGFDGPGFNIFPDFTIQVENYYWPEDLSDLLSSNVSITNQQACGTVTSEITVDVEVSTVLVNSQEFRYLDGAIAFDTDNEVYVHFGYDDLVQSMTEPNKFTYTGSHDYSVQSMCEDYGGEYYLGIVESGFYVSESFTVERKRPDYAEIDPFEVSKTHYIDQGSDGFQFGVISSNGECSDAGRTMKFIYGDPSNTNRVSDVYVGGVQVTDASGDLLPAFAGGFEESVDLTSGTSIWETPSVITFEGDASLGQTFIVKTEFTSACHLTPLESYATIQVEQTMVSTEIEAQTDGLYCDPNAEDTILINKYSNNVEFVDIYLNGDWIDGIPLYSEGQEFPLSEVLNTVRYPFSLDMPGMVEGGNELVFEYYYYDNSESEFKYYDTLRVFKNENFNQYLVGEEQFCTNDSIERRIGINAVSSMPSAGYSLLDENGDAVPTTWYTQRNDSLVIYPWEFTAATYGVVYEHISNIGCVRQDTLPIWVDSIPDISTNVPVSIFEKAEGFDLSVNTSNGRFESNEYVHYDYDFDVYFFDVGSVPEKNVKLPVVFNYSENVESDAACRARYVDSIIVVSSPSRIAVKETAEVADTFTFCVSQGVVDFTMLNYESAHPDSTSMVYVGESEVSSSQNEFSVYLPGYSEGYHDLLYAYYDTLGTIIWINAVLDIRPAPQVVFTTPNVVKIGKDAGVCARMDSIVLNVDVVGTPFGVLWESTGSGEFGGGAYFEETYYNLSDQDYLEDNFDVIVRLVGSDECFPIFDTLHFHVLQQPVVFSGLDEKVCSDVDSIYFNANTSNANQIVWEGGAGGEFSPSDTDAEIYYKPTAADKAAGFVELVTRHTEISLCPLAADTVRIEFVESQTIDLGSSITVCDTDFPLSLNPVTTLTDVEWKGGTGEFANYTFELTNEYSPSEDEILEGEFKIVLVGNDGICPEISDTLSVTVAPGVQITIPKDSLLCDTTTVINLEAQTAPALLGEWSVNGAGTFDKSGLTASYLVTNADIQNDELQFKFTTDGGTCKPTEDSVSFKFIDCDHPCLNPVAAINTTGTEFCSKGSTFIFANEYPKARYTWYKDDKQFGKTQFDHYLLEVEEAGVYKVVINSGVGCVQESPEVIISESVLPTVDINITETSGCENDSTVLSVDLLPGATYTWWLDDQVIAIGEDVNVAYAQKSGVYSVAVRSEEGCENLSRRTRVQLKSAPQTPLVFGAEFEFCNGEELFYQVTPPAEVPGVPSGYVDYKWYINDALVVGKNQSLFKAITGGTYRVEVGHVLNECTSNSEVFMVTENNIAKPSIESDGGKVLKLAVDNISAEFQWYVNGLLITDAEERDYPIFYNGIYQVEVREGDCVIASDPFQVDESGNISAVDAGVIDGAKITLYEPSLEETEEVLNEQLYPNPTSGVFFFDSKSETEKQLWLYNDNGELISNFNTTNSLIEVQTEGLSAGIYILRVASESGTAHFKVFIER